MWIRALAVFLAGAIALFSLLNGRPIYIRVIFENDVAAHAAAFTILTLVVLAAWKRRWRSMGLLSVFAVAIELAQSLTPSRQLAATDLAGNLAGVLIGALVVASIRAWRAASGA